MLYLIEILHQTTTFYDSIHISGSCILSKFYIKPQLVRLSVARSESCILSKFYIKPQRSPCARSKPLVVSYRNSTSNHNLCRITRLLLTLYLIEILHQTTTRTLQTLRGNGLYLIEILHQTTTRLGIDELEQWLYLIEILHQTTTPLVLFIQVLALYLIEILHQTTTQGQGTGPYAQVVSYRNSTSNHNGEPNSD